VKVNDKINNQQKKSLTNDLVLNSSIIVLILINILLISTFLKNLSFNPNTDDSVNADSLKPRIQIEVLNGCGVSGKAETITNYLRAEGIDVVNLGNYRSFEIENSIIISRNNKIKNAQRVASAVGLSESSIISQFNPDYILDVTLILGKDYNELIPLNKRMN
jgi:hypothetical protein